jgi:hypothetical protein
MIVLHCSVDQDAICEKEIGFDVPLRGVDKVAVAFEIYCKLDTTLRFVSAYCIGLGRTHVLLRHRGGKCMEKEMAQVICWSEGGHK